MIQHTSVASLCTSHRFSWLLSCIFFTALAQCNHANGQEVRTFAQLNADAIELYKQGRGDPFDKASVTLLRGTSRPALLEMLTLRDMPILSLAAFNTLSKQSGNGDSTALILLLANAESVLFFDTQFSS